MIIWRFYFIATIKAGCTSRRWNWCKDLLGSVCACLGVFVRSFSSLWVQSSGAFCAVSGLDLMKPWARARARGACECRHIEAHNGARAAVFLSVSTVHRMVHNERPIGGEYRDLTHCMGGRPLFQTSLKHSSTLTALLRSRQFRNLQKAGQIHNTTATIFGNTPSTDLCGFNVLFFTLR